jgi:hypothetical protein
MNLWLIALCFDALDFVAMQHGGNLGSPQAARCRSYTGEGVEVLIHVGIEAAALHREGFRVRISGGQRMSKGDLLVEFDTDGIGEKPDPVVRVANNDRLGTANPF